MQGEIHLTDINLLFTFSSVTVEVLLEELFDDRIINGNAMFLSTSLRWFRFVCQNCNEVARIFGYSVEFDFYVEFCLTEFRTDWRYFDG